MIVQRSSRYCCDRRGAEAATPLVRVFGRPPPPSSPLAFGSFLGTRGNTSESFGTGGVGDGVGHGFPRVAAVVVDLGQDSDVHKNLQQSARPELHGGLREQKVACFEGVAAGPHQHHLDA